MGAFGFSASEGSQPRFSHYPIRGHHRQGDLGPIQDQPDDTHSYHRWTSKDRENPFLNKMPQVDEDISSVPFIEGGEAFGVQGPTDQQVNQAVEVKGPFHHVEPKPIM